MTGEVFQGFSDGLEPTEDELFSRKRRFRARRVQHLPKVMGREKLSCALFATRAPPAALVSARIGSVTAGQEAGGHSPRRDLGGSTETVLR